MNIKSKLPLNQVTPESLPDIQYNNQPVVTTSTLAQLYQTEAKHIQNNHQRNAERFVQGKHFYKLQGAELKGFKNEPSLRGFVGKNASHLILWTDRGAARHAKLLETDSAWDVFEKLEDHYFGRRTATSEQQSLPSTLTPAQQRHIQKRVGELAHTPGNSYQQVYGSIKDKFAVGTYKDIPAADYPDLCRFLQCKPLEGELMPRETVTPIRPTLRLAYSEADLMATGMVDPDGRFKRWANCGPSGDPLQQLLKDLNATAHEGKAVIVEDVRGAIGMYNAMVSMIANDTELMMGLENNVSRMRDASRASLRTIL